MNDEGVTDEEEAIEAMNRLRMIREDTAVLEIVRALIDQNDKVLSMNTDLLKILTIRPICIQEKP